MAGQHNQRPNHRQTVLRVWLNSVEFSLKPAHEYLFNLSELCGFKVAAFVFLDFILLHQILNRSKITYFIAGTLTPEFI